MLLYYLLESRDSVSQTIVDLTGIDDPYPRSFYRTQQLSCKFKTNYTEYRSMLARTTGHLVIYMIHKGTVAIRISA